MHDSRRTRAVLAVLLVTALALITLDARNSAAGPAAMTFAATIRYRPRPASWSSLVS